MLVTLQFITPYLPVSHLQTLKLKYVELTMLPLMTYGYEISSLILR